MLTEVQKLLAVRAIGVRSTVVCTPKVVMGWRAREAVESPSHLRTHPEALRLTLLAALLREREREITDTLVDLLIATVHRVGARAEKKVTTELVNAFKRVSGNPVYRRTVQTTLKASYTKHYRRGLVRLLDVLQFRSSSAHQPVIEALKLIGRFAGAGNTTYFPLGEVVPMHRALRGDWEDVLHREDACGRRRVVRMVYE